MNLTSMSIFDAKAISNEVQGFQALLEFFRSYFGGKGELDG